MTNNFESEATVHSFDLGLASPEVKAAGDGMSGVTNRLVDWCATHPDELPADVLLVQPKKGTIQVQITERGPDAGDITGFAIINRNERPPDILTGIMGSESDNAEDSPLSVTFGVPDEGEASWRKISTIFTAKGQPRIKMTPVTGRIVEPGMVTHRPLDAYAGDPASVTEINDQHAALVTVAYNAGLPTVAFEI